MADTHTKLRINDRVEIIQNIKGDKTDVRYIGLQGVIEKIDANSDPELWYKLYIECLHEHNWFIAEELKLVQTFEPINISEII